SLPWVERFVTLRSLVEANYLPRYLELGTLVSAEEDREAARIAAFMAGHERAGVERAGNVISGKGHPAAPGRGRLALPPPPPRCTRRGAAGLSPPSSGLTCDPRADV